MRKLAIVHFNAIEGYPPVLNWLNFLGGPEGEDMQVRVYTLSPRERSGLFVPSSDRIRIFRTAAPAGRMGLRNYLAFYFGALRGLIGWRPDAILYYETLSSFPALVYKKVVGRKTPLFIHYHEYTSAIEYEKGMKLGRWLHRMEKRSYRLATGISHTNADRIGLFKKDLGDAVLPPLYEFPNYPPSSWSSLSEAGREKPVLEPPVKVVYVGALSMDTMYTREFADWVVGQAGNVRWDIYSDNSTPGARDFLAGLDQELVRFRGSADYFSLPGILAGYDIGVILYKGHIPNYVYNAPNKLFEYMSCGLDTWFPEPMKSIHPFSTRSTYPKVLALDFTALSSWSLSGAISRTGLEYAPSVFYAERIFPGLLTNIQRSMQVQRSIQK
jgi:hypothetical protein